VQVEGTGRDVAAAYVGLLTSHAAAPV
jgi:hypothetical protein